MNCLDRYRAGFKERIMDLVDYLGTLVCASVCVCVRARLGKTDIQHKTPETGAEPDQPGKDFLSEEKSK